MVVWGGYHYPLSMSATTIEKPRDKKSFTGLQELRQELSKQTKNQERLVEFQKTIDEALEEGDRKGVIEFTAKEWTELISDENLPPIEVVKQLLQKKIERMKKITETAKEAKKPLLDTLKEKGKKVKSEWKKLLTEICLPGNDGSWALVSPWE